METDGTMPTKFKEIFDATQSALKQTPSQSEVWYETQTRLGAGVDSTASVRQFSVRVDEPDGLGGLDTAPSPVEYILVALGSCSCCCGACLRARFAVRHTFRANALGPTV